MKKILAPLSAFIGSIKFDVIIITAISAVCISPYFS